MKFPVKGTCAYAICKNIHVNGSRTQDIIYRDLSARYSIQTIRNKLFELKLDGIIEMIRNVYYNTQRTTCHMSQCELIKRLVPNDTPLPVPYRIHPPFKPLIGYTLPVDGFREGAGEHRKFKSRHL